MSRRPRRRRGESPPRRSRRFWRIAPRSPGPPPPGLGEEEALSQRPPALHVPVMRPGFRPVPFRPDRRVPPGPLASAARTVPAAVRPATGSRPRGCTRGRGPPGRWPRRRRRRWSKCRTPVTLRTEPSRRQRERSAGSRAWPGSGATSSRGRRRSLSARSRSFRRPSLAITRPPADPWRENAAGKGRREKTGPFRTPVAGQSWTPVDRFLKSNAIGPCASRPLATDRPGPRIVRHSGQGHRAFRAFGKNSCWPSFLCDAIAS